MAYTKTTWQDNVTPTSATNLNNLEKQYDQAKADYEAGNFTPPENVETPAGAQAKADSVQANLDTHLAENAHKYARSFLLMGG